MIKFILGFVLLFLPIISHAETPSKCKDSYFIHTTTNILDTMNTLISGGVVANNSFTCDGYKIVETTDGDYSLFIETKYENIPYEINFKGHQANNNNGKIFIPDYASLTNKNTLQKVNEFHQQSIIGACTFDTKEKLLCLVALNEGGNRNIAVKIKFP